MRDVLFRGKRTDNGKWEIGSLIVYSDGECFICCEETKDILNKYQVISETVGQYTGLIDNNGTKIFEGDIVKTKKYGKNVGNINVNDYDIFTVIYEPCTFRLVKKSRGFNLVDDEYSKYQVIGNIHDNSELLKGGE